MSDGSPGEEPTELETEYGEPEDPAEDRLDVGPEIPEVPDPTETDADPDPKLVRRFWALVAVFNGAVLAVSLGVMVAVFEGDFSLGGQLLAGGLIVAAFGLYRYRTTKQQLEELTSTDDGDSSPESDSTARERNG